MPDVSIAIDYDHEFASGSERLLYRKGRSSIAHSANGAIDSDSSAGFWTTLFQCLAMWCGFLNRVVVVVVSWKINPLDMIDVIAESAGVNTVPKASISGK